MKVGIIQICSELDYQKNLKKIRGFLDSHAKDLDAVFLPEVFYSMSDAKNPTPYLVDPNGGEHIENIKALGKDYGVYILGGTAATKPEKEGDKVINRNYNISPNGEELDFYDKMNLFSCDLSKHKSGTVIDEGDVYQAGDKPKILDLGDWKVGLSICFDLRFPEMYRRYSFGGANLLSISAAFTRATGKAHWETLLRARAIENQCYVIAPAQWGEHNDVIKTWGHSMIIDPWGEILVNAEEGEKIITAELSLDRIENVRSRLNVIREI